MAEKKHVSTTDVEIKHRPVQSADEFDQCVFVNQKVSIKIPLSMKSLWNTLSNVFGYYI